MLVTVSAIEPLILREAQPGDLFLLHVPNLAECVFTLLRARSTNTAHEHVGVVCMGCRVGKADRGFIQIGTAITAHIDSPMTLLDQVEHAAFRSRPLAGVASQSHSTGHQAQPEPISRL